MKNILKKLLEKLSGNARDISFKVRLWDGEILRFGNNSPNFALNFTNEQSASNLFQRGILGFAEEYIAGNIRVRGDFLQLMRLGADPVIRNLKLSLKTKIEILLRYICSINTIDQTTLNISKHYDLGNDFYKLWLDESMTYSCAYFNDGSETIEKAQQQKYEHICRKLMLKEGETMVDIGCGWGGMLIYAAKHYGVKGVGCTLSRQQAVFARTQVKREGLEDMVDIILDDYRNISGQFDKLVSIGMFEHVGRNYIPAFMHKARSLLKKGGIGLLHTIGNDVQSYCDPFTVKYIFPGGYIPSLEETIREMGKKELVPLDIENLRPHYALTLERWSRRFEEKLEDIGKMFGPEFVRMWRLYLNGSIMSFRYGNIRLFQIAFTNGLNNSLPLTRSHIYSS